MPFPCCSPAALKANLHVQCRSLATTLPLLCHSPIVTKAVRSLTCRLWTADANSHIPCRSHAIPLLRHCCGLERSLSERHVRGMVRERPENGTTFVNQTRPHYVNQVEKTQSKPLAEGHGRGTAWYM
jgi:hypothetical protein